MESEDLLEGVQDPELFRLVLSRPPVPLVLLTLEADLVSLNEDAPPEKRKQIHRDRRDGLDRLQRDYLGDAPVYSDEQFQRRFRLPRSLFMRIVDTLRARDTYFTCRRDAVGRAGFTTEQKITAALRMLASGESADRSDEYVRMGESTARETLVRFARKVSLNFSEYLRYPTREEAQNISSRMSRSGFPGCIGSLDCMTLEWKNCPSGWAGYYKGRGKKPSIILEAVADDQLYCWHAFFGMPGSNNEINVLDSSTLRSAWVAGQYPPQFEFVVNRVIHNLPYLLVDGIYPRYRTFISTVNQPGSQKEKSFCGAQEARRKDVERLFGVLQARWAFLKTPCRLYSQEDIGYCVNACILLHNMIIRWCEDVDGTVDFLTTENMSNEEYSTLSLPNIAERVSMVTDVCHIRNNDPNNLNIIMDANACGRLKRNLIEHIWNNSGNLH
jgi:hypothetical protein